MYYSAIGLLAVLLLFIVNWDILHNPRVSYKKKAWHVYRRFLLAVLMYYIVDIVWGIFESQKMATLLFSDTTLYFVAMAVGVFFWAEFTVVYLEENNRLGSLLVSAGFIIAGLITLLSIVNIFIPILFTVDGDSVYHALPARYVLLAVQIIFLLLISLYAFSQMRKLDRGSVKRRRYHILVSFGLIMAIFLFAQLWFPEFPLYAIAYMLGTSLLHSFVANDEKEEYERGLEEAEKITELKETITSLLNNMPGLNFTKDAKTGEYLACNQAFAAYANKPDPDSVTGLTDAELFDAETAAHFVHDDKIALSMSAPYIFYEEVTDAAGNARQLQTTKYKYKDTAGRLCVLGMCQDVTDLVRIQHENAMTKEAYESAVSAGLIYTQIAQTLARDYTDLFYVNCDTEEFIEYRLGEDGSALTERRRGWHFFSDCKEELSESVYPEDRNAFLKAMKRKTLMKALRRKDTFVMNYRQMTGDSTVYVRMNVSLMNDVRFIIVGITDVDAEMREAMAKSEALAEALSAAENASRAKTSFLSNLSHEIRSPMNAIIGLDALALKNENLDAKTRENLEKIGKSANHLLALINDILEMSRLESGRTVLRREVFSLGSLLEQLNGLFGGKCREKGLSYICRMPEKTEDSYIGDDGKLREALANLLSNAVKFTEAPGSVTLTAEQVATGGEKATLRFSVKDTGIGIEEEFLPRLFEPFGQDDIGHKTRYGSTGLGLAITKRIVEMMDGEITVKSKKGVGTEFVVELRLEICDREGTDKSFEVDLTAMSVLVVDDNPIDAEHARSMLEEVGIRPDMAQSGAEALHRMEVQHELRKPYNLVLMDWQMPGMNGLETSAEIRKEFGDESTIVFMTSYNWDDIQEEAQKIGVHSFLEKPLSPVKILEEFERIARRGNMALSAEKKRAEIKGRHILLAEDMEINAEILMDSLAIDDIRVDHAENGAVVVEMFANSMPGTYSAILMDVRMPVLDGLEATEAIRALDRPDAKKIPIIALTANAFDEDVQSSLAAGMNAHLAKPVNTELLYQTLGELIYEAEEG